MDLHSDNYNRLCRTIEASVKRVPFTDLSHYNKIIILGTNNMSYFKKYVDELYEVCPEIDITIISPKTKQDVYRDYLRERAKFIEWNSEYTLDLAGQIRSKIDLSSIDAMFYFSNLSIDLRDLNIMEIGLTLNDKNVVPLYCVSQGEELFHHTNLALEYKGLKLYMAINEYLDECLNNKV